MKERIESERARASETSINMILFSGSLLKSEKGKRGKGLKKKKAL